MKLIIRYYLNIFCFTILSLSVAAQKLEGYEIDGYIKGLHEGEKVIMSLVALNNSFVKRDSGYVIKGKFRLAGYVPEGPQLYFMDFSDHPSQTCRLLINNNEKITVNCDSTLELIKHSYLDNFFKIAGSSSNDAWHRLTTASALYTSYIAYLNRSLQKIQDSVGFSPQLVEPIINSKKVFTYAAFWQMYMAWDVAYENSRATIPFNILGDGLQNRSGHDSYLVTVYGSLDSATKNSYWGKIFGKYAAISLGQKFPEFNLPNTDGKLIALKNVVSKGKRTIVHFWATNSYQRENYQKELMAFYTKYHDKGLNVICVSADSVDYVWKGFLKNHVSEYPWPNVSDLKGNLEGGIVNDVYFEGGHSVPNTTNVLLDTQGNIITWDPSSVELQYYLWKTFGG